MNLTPKENGHKGRLAAVIIEPRQHRYIYRVIKHFMNQLDPNIPFFLFYGKSKFQHIYNYFYRDIKSKKLTIIQLPVDNLSYSQYNVLLKQKQLYSFIPYDKLLFFQTDAWINTKSRYKIDNFIKFDYIGGYSVGPEGIHGNGGVSLRDRKLSLLAIDRFAKKLRPNYPEDVFFNYSIKKLKGLVSCQKTLPQVHGFCCNYSYTDPNQHHPLFFHKVLTNTRHGKKIMKYCPDAAGLMIPSMKLSQIVIPRKPNENLTDAKKKYSILYTSANI